MSKRHDKIAKALEARRKATPSAKGFKAPGSMNKRKTGYAGGKR